MTTLSPGFCPNCGKQTDTNFRYCEHCAADLTQFRQPPPQPLSQAPTNADETSEAKSLMKRYKDAYRVARTTTGMGSTIKGIGALLGLLIFFGAFVLAGGQRNVYGVRSGEIQVIAMIVAAIFGGTVWLVFFIWGVLVSAQGQILKASLDGAVNGSPFLTNEQRATIMSL